MNDIAAARRASTSGSSAGASSSLLDLEASASTRLARSGHRLPSLAGPDGPCRVPQRLLRVDVHRERRRAVRRSSAATASTAARTAAIAGSRSRERDHQLRALAPLAPEQRRRAEHRHPGGRDRLAHGLAAAVLRARLVGRADHPDQVPERRVARAPRGAPARRRGSRRRRARPRGAGRARPGRAPARSPARRARRDRCGRRAARPARTCAPRRGSRGSAAWRRRRAPRRASRPGSRGPWPPSACRPARPRSARVEAPQHADDARAGGRRRRRAGTPAGASTSRSSSRSSRSVPAPWRATDTDPQSGQSDGTALAVAAVVAGQLAGRRCSTSVTSQCGALPDAPARAGTTGSSTSRAG